MTRPAPLSPRPRRLGAMARGLWVLLLPLWLVLAQHGALLHELSHQIADDATEQTHPTHGQVPCQLCQAFAQVSDLSAAHPVIAFAAPALRFHHAEAVDIGTRSAAVPAQRNRGPPVVG